MDRNNTFKALCPNCGAITEQWLIECDDEILINDDPVTVQIRYYYCLACEEDYEVPSIDYKPLAEDCLKLGLRSNEDLVAIVNILKIALNIKEMRQWLEQNYIKLC